MLLKVAFALMTVLAIVGGIIALTGEPPVAAGFSFGTAAVGAVSVAYLVGRDGKKQKL